jgi:hypothetical protein
VGLWFRGCRGRPHSCECGSVVPWCRGLTPSCECGSVVSWCRGRGPEGRAVAVQVRRTGVDRPLLDLWINQRGGTRSARADRARASRQAVFCIQRHARIAQ